MDLIRSWQRRSFPEKFIDGAGLIFQSLLVPLIAAQLGIHVMPLLFQFEKQSLIIPFWLQFLLPFTLIDYAYYWNHRLFHRSEFWWLHRTHHSAKSLDIFVTSRNSIWTVFFLVYIWSQAFLIYSQIDHSGFLYGSLCFAAMDVWRHSGLRTPMTLRKLGAVLILPEDHEWHHSKHQTAVNFGANLNLWDRMHGTFYRNWERPGQLGNEEPLNLWPDFLWPWSSSQRSSK